MRQFLEEKYAGSLGAVDAVQYPPHPMGVVAVQIAGVTQMALIVLMIGGTNVFKMLGVAPVPEWYQVIADNKILAFGSVWMGNNVAAQLVATGAFEIEVDGVLVFSKLETGRLPDVNDIHSAMRRLGLQQATISAGGAGARANIEHEDEKAF